MSRILLFVILSLIIICYMLYVKWIVYMSNMHVFDPIRFEIIFLSVYFHVCVLYVLNAKKKNAKKHEIMVVSKE